MLNKRGGGFEFVGPSPFLYPCMAPSHCHLSSTLDFFYEVGKEIDDPAGSLAAAVEHGEDMCLCSFFLLGSMGRRYYSMMVINDGAENRYMRACRRIGERMR